LQHRQPLQYAHSCFSLLHSFAPERSTSPLLSTTSALFACLPGVASRAQFPFWNSLTSISLTPQSVPSFDLQLSTFNSPLSPAVICAIVRCWCDESAPARIASVTPLESALTKKPGGGVHYVN